MSVADSWGTTAEERRRSYPCDALAGDDWAALYRSVSVRARPATVFRWLCQMRKAPYSYDWLDNFGRRSPRKLIPGLEQLEIGQSVMTIFRIVSFEPDLHLTLELAAPLSGAALAYISYVVAPEGNGSRLTAKIVGPPAKGRLARTAWRALAWADLVMMRKQLLNFRQLAEQHERSISA
jgi:hypothetical protein